MRARVAHRYVGEIRIDGKPPITTAALAVDWAPAVDWCHFQAVRAGAAALNSTAGRASIRPRWDRQAGPPYVAAVEVSASCGPAMVVEREVSKPFFADAVRRAVSHLVEVGRIEEGATYTWRLCAYDAADGAEPDPVPAGRFVVDEAEPPAVALPPRRVSDLLRNASRHGPQPDAADRNNFPALINRQVLDEAAQAATAAGDLEAGGVLLGRVGRDVEAGDLVVEVTAQVPATEAVAEDASLRFTPQTWAAVQAALRLRRSDERIVGWWHSHPRTVWPCHACPAERRAGCPSNKAFFSAMDVGFHRTAFPGPLNVALLLSFHEAPQPRHDLFGWWQGLVGEREYYVVEEAA